MYSSTLGKPIFRNELTSLAVDYTLFVKWLIKIAYNSARVHHTDLDVLDDYASLLIDQSNLPENLHVLVATVAPAIIDDQGKPAMATREDAADACNPSWFRVGVFRVPEFNSMYWSFRHLAINSFSFFLFIPKIGSDEAKAEESQLLHLANKDNTFGVELLRTDSTQLLAPNIDSLNYSMSQIAAFPFSYKLIHNEAVKSVIDGEFGAVLWFIERNEIESKNTKDIFEFLTDITSSREIAKGFLGRVEFAVNGYEDDPRALDEIPEVRDFLRVVDESWAHWFMFQHPTGHWLRVLALCLCDSKRTSSATVEFDSLQMENLVSRWFGKLNELSHKLLITTEVNKRLSADAIKVLFGTNA